jgi:hypothetical protein
MSAGWTLARPAASVTAADGLIRRAGNLAQLIGSQLDEVLETQT